MTVFPGDAAKWAQSQVDSASKQNYDAFGRMHQYVDPLTGTISYSGADVKVVAFIPFDLEQLRLERESLQEELTQLETTVNTLRDTWDGISQDYRLAVQNGNASSVSSLAMKLQYLPISRINRLETELYSLRQQKARLDEAVSGQTDGQSVVAPLQLTTAQTISVSVYRDKFPVRTLGRVNPKSRVRGQRTIGGSMICTVFNKHALWHLLQAGLKFYNTGVGVSGTDSGYPELSTVLPDQLPPFDISLVCSNEIGDNSSMVLYGIEFLTEGQTMSIEDMLTEATFQFTALDYDPLRPLSESRAILDGQHQILPKTASDVLAASRREGRLNPFI